MAEFLLIRKKLNQKMKNPKLISQYLFCFADTLITKGVVEWWWTKNGRSLTSDFRLLPGVDGARMEKGGVGDEVPEQGPAL